MNGVRFGSLVVGACLFASIVGVAAGGPPDTLWTKFFGGANTDGAYAVAVARDSGYFAAGFQNGSAASRRWYVHTDRDGNQTWDYLGSALSYAHDISPASDGGCFVCGWYRETYPDTSIDAWVHRRNAGGSSAWQRIYSYGGAYWDDRAYAVAETYDQGCAVAVASAVTGGHVWLIRLSSGGTKLWDKSYTAHWYWTVPCWIGETPDSGLAVVGHSSAGSQSDFFLLRVGPQGETLWSRTWGGPQEDRAADGALCADGGFALCGYTRSFGAGGADILVVRTDSSGETLWSRTWGTTANEEGRGISEMPDRGFIICGSGSAGPIFIRTDESGETLWTKTLEGGGAVYSVSPTPEGDIIAAGQKNGDAWLIKMAGQSGQCEEADPVRVARRRPTLVRSVLPVAGTGPAALADASGRVVLRLRPGANDLGRIRPGVYFVLAEGAASKVIVAR